MADKGTDLFDFGLLSMQSYSEASNVNNILEECQRCCALTLNLIERVAFELITPNNSLEEKSSSKSTIGVMLNGTAVADTVFGGPAYNSGLVPGDVVLEINDEPVSKETIHQALVRDDEPGALVTFKIAKGGKNGPIREVAMTRISTETIADRRRIFELFATLKERATIGHDPVLGNTIEQLIQLWKTMTINSVAKEKKVADSINEVQKECSQLLIKLQMNPSTATIHNEIQLSRPFHTTTSPVFAPIIDIASPCAPNAVYLGTASSIMLQHNQSQAAAHGIYEEMHVPKSPSSGIVSEADFFALAVAPPAASTLTYDSANILLQRGNNNGAELQALREELANVGVSLEGHRSLQDQLALSIKELDRLNKQRQSEDGQPGSVHSTVCAQEHAKVASELRQANENLHRERLQTALLRQDIARITALYDSAQNEIVSLKGQLASVSKALDSLDMLRAQMSKQSSDLEMLAKAHALAVPESQYRTVLEENAVLQSRLQQLMADEGGFEKSLAAMQTENRDVSMRIDDVMDENRSLMAKCLSLEDQLQSKLEECTTLRSQMNVSFESQRKAAGLLGEAEERYKALFFQCEGLAEVLDALRNGQAALSFENERRRNDSTQQKLRTELDDVQVVSRNAAVRNLADEVREGLMSITVQLNDLEAVNHKIKDEDVRNVEINQQLHALVSRVQFDVTDISNIIKTKTASITYSSNIDTMVPEQKEIETGSELEMMPPSCSRVSLHTMLRAVHEELRNAMRTAETYLSRVVAEVARQKDENAQIKEQVNVRIEADKCLSERVRQRREEVICIVKQLIKDVACAAEPLQPSISALMDVVQSMQIKEGVLLSQIAALEQDAVRLASQEGEAQAEADRMRRAVTDASEAIDDLDVSQEHLEYEIERLKAQLDGMVPKAELERLTEENSALTLDFTKALSDKQAALAKLDQLEVWKKTLLTRSSALEAQLHSLGGMQTHNQIHRNNVFTKTVTIPLGTSIRTTQSNLMGSDEGPDFLDILEHASTLVQQCELLKQRCSQADSCAERHVQVMNDVVQEMDCFTDLVRRLASCDRDSEVLVEELIELHTKPSIHLDCQNGSGPSALERRQIGNRESDQSIERSQRETVLADQGVEYMTKVVNRAEMAGLQEQFETMDLDSIPVIDTKRVSTQEDTAAVAEIKNLRDKLARVMKALHGNDRLRDMLVEREREMLCRYDSAQEEIRSLASKLHKALSRNGELELQITECEEVTARMRGQCAAANVQIDALTSRLAGLDESAKAVHSQGTMDDSSIIVRYGMVGAESPPVKEAMIHHGATLRKLAVAEEEIRHLRQLLDAATSETTNLRQLLARTGSNAASERKQSAAMAAEKAPVHCSLRPSAQSFEEFTSDVGGDPLAYSTTVAEEAMDPASGQSSSGNKAFNPKCTQLGTGLTFASIGDKWNDESSPSRAQAEDCFTTGRAPESCHCDDARPDGKFCHCDAEMGRDLEWSEADVARAVTAAALASQLTAARSELDALQSLGALMQVGGA